MKGPFGLTIAGVLLITMLMVIGCSGGNSPLVPPDKLNEAAPQTPQAGGTMLWGAWTIAVDTETETADIVEARMADYCLNVLSFLEPPPLVSLNISNLQILPSQNRVNVDVLLTHPFSTNGQFHGFDVKGVVFGPTLLNTDGYTAWMNPYDFKGIGFGYQDGLLGAPDSHAHYPSADWGFKYYADNLGANASIVNFFSNTTNLNQRGIFSEGTTNTRHYELDFGTPSKFLIFNYAVVANYDWPTGTPPYTLGDFPIATANGQEAFCIDAWDFSNGLWYDPVYSTGGGTFDLDVEVWDWQGLSNTSVYVQATGLPITSVSTYGPGSCSYSGIFNFTALAPNLTSSNPITLTITATDTSATFGSAWFMGLLPTSNSKYNTAVYTTIKAQVSVATAGGYYNKQTVTDFVLWPYPHQSAGICWDFVDYYNFTAPATYGRHDLCVIPYPGMLKVIDTVGFGVGGPPPPGGGIIYDIPLPLGSAPEIPAPYFAGPASPPNLFPPWEPTRFDSNSAEFEMGICSGNLNPYIFSPFPAPEYSITQIYHVPPGAGGPPFIVDMDPFTWFPGAVPWDVGVDVTNGFYNSGTGQFGPLYGLFFFDYNTWMNCGYWMPPPGAPMGFAWVWELPLPAAPGVVNPIMLPTSVGAPAPGPGFIDDSSTWGVCGSMAADSQPQNQPGLITPNPTMVYILDSEGDIEIFEVDFAGGIWQAYSCISDAYSGTGLMAADIEMIDSAKVATLGLPGYVPNTNMLAVAMVDGNIGSSQGDWWIDVYTIVPGTDTATLHGSTAPNTGQPFLAMDVDEITGDIYVLHGSNSKPGSTAISVYSYL
jgi:hypothetical protein